jgi:hypothetical protein
VAPGGQQILPQIWVSGEVPKLRKLKKIWQFSRFCLQMLENRFIRPLKQNNCRLFRTLKSIIRPFYCRVIGGVAIGAGAAAAGGGDVKGKGRRRRRGARRGRMPAAMDGEDEAVLAGVGE